MPTRSRYTPLQSGFIIVVDPWHKRMGWLDCRAGGAQDAFDELCRGFQRAGWELGERYFDNRFVRRRDVRWNVFITRADPLMTEDRRDSWQS